MLTVKFTLGQGKHFPLKQLASVWLAGLGVSTLLQSWSGFPSASPPLIPVKSAY